MTTEKPFKCGHPRTPENTAPNGSSVRCAFCARVDCKVASVDKVLARWKRESLTAAEHRVRKYCGV